MHRAGASARPGIRAVVLSAHTEPEYIDQALEAGAVAYVVKSAHPDDLASADPSGVPALDLLRRVAARALGRLVASRIRGGSLDLTRREREVLQLVAEGHSNAKLAQMLWVTEQTVKFHLSNVYRKLDVSNRTEAARWAQLNGLLSVGGQSLGDREARLVAQ